MYRKKLSPEQALQKARHYCGYQERSHEEARVKLYTYGLSKSVVEELLSRLIEEDYLNEERYANLFAGGKFRMKQWGRIRIQYELKQRKVSVYCIKKALGLIDEHDYEQTLRALAQKKWDLLRAAGDSPITCQAKLYQYLTRKGYEPEKIREAVKKIDGPGGGRQP